MDVTFTISDAELAGLQALVDLENSHRMTADRVLDGADLARSLARAAVREKLALVAQKRIDRLHSIVDKADPAVLDALETAVKTAVRR